MIPLYKSYIIRIIVSALFLFSSTNSIASHIVGAEMHYAHVTGNNYKVTVILYGDCGPASSGAFGTLASATPKVCVYNGETMYTTLTLSVEAPAAGVEITPVCATDMAMTQCTSTAYAIPGIKKFVYSANVTLSEPSLVWRFIFAGDYGISTAGRAVSITNLSSAGVTSIRLVDTLNNLSFPANSNARLTTIPTPFFCLNQMNSYNPGAVDAEGDRLEFLLVPATGGSTTCTSAGAPVSYAGTAWPGQLIGPSTPLQCLPASYSFDTSTGQLGFNPNFAQRSVVVYNVREFRGGIMVGSSQREMTFYVRPCTNVPPSGIWDSTTAGVLVDTATLRICAGSGVVRSYINPTDPEGDTINVTVSGLPAGAVLNTTNNNTPSPHSVFSWNTTGVAPGTYTFFVTFTDNNCPDQGTLTQAFTIVVTPPLAVTGSLTLCPGSTSTLSAVPTGGVWGSGNPSVATVLPSGTVSGISIGTALVSYVTTAGCSSTVVVTVNATATVNPITGAGIVCEGGSVSLANATPGGVWTVAGPATISSGGVLAGTGAGTVTVFYGVSNICGTVYASRIVTVAPLAPAIIISGADSLCTGASAVYSASISGGTWSGGSSFFTVSGTGSVTGVTTGTGTLSYTITNACGTSIGSRTVTVLPFTPPVITLTGPSLLCVGNAFVMLPTPSGGIFVSDNPLVASLSGAGIIGGVSAGTANISYSVSNECGSNTVVRTLTVNPLATVGGITGADTVCEGSSIMMTNTTTGGVWLATGAATVNATTGLVTGTAGGTAIISYLVANLCNTAIATRIITVLPIPVAGSISGSSVVCTSSVISLSTTASGGLWSGGAPSASVSATGVVTGLVAGTATISYAVGNSCGTSYTTHVVTVNNAPTPAGTISGPSALCAGATATLMPTISGGTWGSSTPTVATVSGSGEVSGIAAGTSVLSYFVAAGACGTAFTTHIIAVDTTLLPDNIVGTDRVCVGSTVSLSHSVTGGSWSATGGVSVSPSGTVTGIVGGTANVSYTLANSCGSAVVTKTITVDVVPDAGIINGPDSVCTGWTIGMIASLPGGTWSVSGGTASVSTSGLVTGSTPGTAIITYTLVNGCGPAFTTDTISVRFGAAVSGSIAGSASVCTGSTITLSFPVSGGTWLSSNAGVAAISAGGMLSGLSAGTTTVSYAITDICGVFYATQVVTVHPLPVAGPIVGALTVCEGAITTLSAPGSGVWSASGAVSVSSFGVVSGISAGTATVTYTISDVCGTSSVAAVVTVSPLPIAGIVSGPDTICVGGMGTLASTILGGTWSGGFPNASISASGVVAPLAFGTAIISYTTANSCGTIHATKLITISGPPSAGSISGAAAICSGSSVSLTPTIAGGIWAVAATGIATVSATGIVTGITAGSAIISYTVSSICGIATATQNILVNGAPPTPSVSGTAIVCAGATTVLTGIPAGGVWAATGAAIVSSSGVVTGIAGGLVPVTYTVSNICGNNFATHLVTVNATSSAGSISGPATLCVAGAITMSATVVGGTWSSSSLAVTTGSNGVVTGVYAGTTVISYTVVNSCGAAVATHTVNVIAIGPFPGPLSGTTTLCQGATTLWTGGIGGGVWASSEPSVAVISSSSGIITGISAGTATISYSVSSGSCGMLTAMRVVTVLPTPTTAALIGPVSLCAGSTVVIGTSIAGGTWSSTGTVSVSGTGVVTGLAAGTGIVSYTRSNTCGTVTTTHALTVVNAPLAAIISGPTATCTGWSVALAASLPGGMWSGGGMVATVSAGGVVTGLAAGSAVISYTITNACGSVHSTHTVTITSATVPTGTVTGPLSLCVGATGAYSHPHSGLWSVSNPAVATISSTGMVTAVSVGTAVITHSIGGPCGTAISTTVLIIHAPPAPVTITGPGSVCAGAAVSLGVSPAGGVWTISGTGSIVTSGIVTGVSAGTAVATYTLNNGCGSTMATYIVTINPAPSPALVSGPSSVCVGVSSGPLSASVPGGIWLGGLPHVAITASGVFTGVTTGVGIVTYLHSNSCGSAITTYSITANASITPAIITGGTTLCVGASSNLYASVTGGVWNSGATATATVSATGVVTGVSAGLAVISYVVSNSCGSYTAVVMVTVSPAVAIAPITGPSALCLGGSIGLACATPGGVWSVSGPATITGSGMVSGITGGIATVSYTLAGGSCGLLAATRTISIDIAPSAGSISGPVVVCQGQTVALSSSVAGGTWSIVGSAATISASGIVSGITPGTATVSYAVVNGCGPASADYVLTVLPAPVVGTLTGPASLCTGALATIVPSVSGGTWAGGSMGVATISPAGVVTAIGVGTTSFTYTITSGGCSSEAVHVVFIDSLPDAGSISGGSSICANATNVLSASASGGVWSCVAIPTGAATINTSGLLSGYVAGSAIISYAVTNACGTSVATYAISVLPSPNAGTIIGADTICVGFWETYTSTETTPGTWTASPISVANITSYGFLTSYTVGDVTVSFKVTGANGCIATAVKLVNIAPLPNPGVITGVSELCTNAAITLTGTVAGGTWSTDDIGTISVDTITGMVSPVRPGRAIITYTVGPDAAGCSNWDTGIITVLAVPRFIISARVQEPSCYNTFDGAIDVSITNGVGPWKYLWTHGPGTEDINGISRGNYEIHVTDEYNNCAATRTISITQPDSLLLTVAVTNERCRAPNGTAEVVVSGGSAPYTYLWSTGGTMAAIDGLWKGNYLVTVVDKNGCRNETSAYVDESNCEDVVVNTGVSPNGDGVNDYWVISGLGSYPNHVVQLFDKWGDLVFEKRSYDNEWDGRDKSGTPMPDGSYFYVIRLNPNGGAGSKDVVTGTILVKR